MALVPFSYANPFTDQLQLRERLFTIEGRLLRIQQAWKGDGKGGTDIGFGASVYPAAYVLAEYLERNSHIVRGKRVIELGTGTGFLGIATAVLGAAEVCLTDGDEESLRLTKKNADTNLPSTASGSIRSHPEATACSHQHQQTQTPAACGSETGECYPGKRSSSSSSSSSTNVTPDGGTVGGSARSSEDCGLQPDPAKLGEEMEGGPEGDVARPAGATGGAATAASPGRDGVGAGGLAGGDGSGGGRQKSKRVSVRKLRWGCEEDMRAVCGRAGRGWDVVLGSDIAALPYASAYGDLLRTIVSLVNDKPDGGGGGCPGAALALDRGGGGEGAGGNETRPRRVTVLLAHKRRHVSEEAFFENLEERLGGEKSVRKIGEDAIHADFRGMGIRLHMFEVDV